MNTKTIAPNTLFGNPDGTLSDAERAFIATNFQGLTSAAITGIAAARVRGLRTYSPVRFLDLTLPDGVGVPARNRWKHERRYTRGTVTSAEVVAIGEFRVVPMIHTLLHIQKLYGDVDTLVATDSLRAREPYFTEGKLLALADDLSGQSGVRGLRRMISMSEPTTRSPLESVGRYRLLSGDFSRIHSIEYEVKIEICDSFGNFTVYYADILINGFLVVELDGRSKYTTMYGKDPVETVVNERIREHMIQNCGFVVRRGKWKDMKLDPWGRCAFVEMIYQAVRAYPEPRRPLPRYFQL